MSLRIACDLDGTIADMDAALQREAKRLFGPEVDLHADAKRTESAEDVEGTIAGADADVDRGEGEPLDPARGKGHEREQGWATPEEAGMSEQPVAPQPVAPSQSVTRPLTARELRQLWSHVTNVENFWTSLGEIEPGAVAKLYALAVQHRWEVLFLTQRPQSAGDLAQLQSQRWLQAHGFEWPSLFVMRTGSRGKVADALGLDAVIDDRPENCLDVATDSKAKPICVWRMHPDGVPPGIARTGIEVVYSMEQALARLEQLMEERARRRTFMGRLRNAIAPAR